MSNLIDHAKLEFLAAGYEPIEESKDGPNKWIQESVLELLSVFSEQGHSGMSAPACIGIFEKLAMFEPLVPLTGDDCEWIAVDEGLFQNKRCSHVFKGDDGRAYDIEGKIFKDNNGCFYTSKESRVYIKFPYTPVREYVDA